MRIDRLTIIVVLGVALLAGIVAYLHRPTITVRQLVHPRDTIPSPALVFATDSVEIYFDTSAVLPYVREVVADSVEPGGVRQRYVGLEQMIVARLNAGNSVVYLEDEYVALELVLRGAVAVRDPRTGARPSRVVYEEYTVRCASDCWTGRARLRVRRRVLLEVELWIT